MANAGLRVATIQLLLLLGIAHGALNATTSQLDALRASISGEVVVGASDVFFEDMLVNHLRSDSDLFAAPLPAVYVAVADEDDVLAAVGFAIDHGLKLAFRGGGHNQAATSLAPGGLTIDMGALKDVHIDPITRTGRFQLGLQGREVANATAPYNLHFRVGHAASVGIAGFVLGGGAGWAGVAVDQVIALDVVNVWEYPEQPLRVVTVTSASEPELFFALQGAGQLTGAVVAITAQLQPLPADGLLRVQNFAWPLAAADAAWAVVAALEAARPPGVPLEEGYVYAQAPGLGPILLASLTDWGVDNSTGVPALLDEFAANASAAGGQLLVDSRVPYLGVIESQSEMQDYANVTHYTWGLILAAVTPELVAILDGGAGNVTSPRSILLVDRIDNTTGKGNADTAFGWRGHYTAYPWAFWTRTAGGAEADGDAEHIAWVEGLRQQIEALPEFLGYYSNFLSYQSADETRMSFPAANWERVVAAKAAYDPHSLFRDLDFAYADAGHGGAEAA